MSRLFAKPARWIWAAVIGLTILTAVIVGSQMFHLRAAVDQVERHGGRVGFVRPAWFARLVSAGRVPWPFIDRELRFEVHSVSFRNADLRLLVNHLQNLSHVTSLDLAGTAVSDTGLAPLRRLPALGSLSLSDTSVSDAGLRHVSRSSGLVFLDLSRTSISDRGLTQLESLNKITELNLDATRVTDSCVPTLMRFARLRELSVAETDITEAGLALLMQRASPISVYDD